MRVIAGQFKSRRLKTLAGERTRPTSDRLRETLFNVLGASVVGALFADCYAASGAVGIEALSRGAEWVYFLEKFRPATRAIEANLSSLGVTGGYEILALDVAAALRRLERENIRLDIVFLDPPYRAAEEYQRTLSLLGRAELLAANATVIAEHHPKQSLLDRYDALHRVRSLRQGDAVLTFFRIR
jgi:16S rRNA (guanine(966)-N(2))-methyltransferase RsmD